MPVVNKAPTDKVQQNTYEASIPVVPAADTTAGKNTSCAAYTFEQRVNQESGTH